MSLFSQFATRCFTEAITKIHRHCISSSPKIKSTASKKRSKIMEPQSQKPAPNITQPMEPSYASTPIVNQPVGIMHVIPNNDFYEDAKNMFCPYCQANIITYRSYTNGCMTWAVSGIICCAGGIAGCCLIPFYMDMFKDVVHSCPNCGKELGLYKRL